MYRDTLSPPSIRDIDRIVKQRIECGKQVIKGHIGSPGYRPFSFKEKIRELYGNKEWWKYTEFQGIREIRELIAEEKAKKAQEEYEAAVRAVDEE